MDDITWAPEECTLPTAERPLRVAEFDALFAGPVRAAERPEPRRLRLGLEPSAAGRAADLAVRETCCCSFFTFTLTAIGGEAWLDIAVPAGREGVLDAMTARMGTP